MEKISLLSYSTYFLRCPARNPTDRSILIVPNSAGYFAESPKYGKAAGRLVTFFGDLSNLDYNVYYLVLPGQDRKYAPDSKYTYYGSIQAVVNVIQLMPTLPVFSFEKDKIIGIIGMCTGSAIAVEAMAEMGLSDLPLVLYNTAPEVGWNNPDGQDAFIKKYSNFVNIDCEELRANAPADLGPIIQKHDGQILQIVCGNSDYSVEMQEKIKVADVVTKNFTAMSDVPIATSEEYVLMLNGIVSFFQFYHK